MLLADHVLSWCCAGDGGSQTAASGEIEPKGESAQNEPSQCHPARIHHWKRRVISHTAVSSRGDLINFIYGGVKMGVTKNAHKAEATRQKKQHNYVGWRGRVYGKDWGKGVGMGEDHTALCPDFVNPEKCES